MIVRKFFTQPNPRLMAIGLIAAIAMGATFRFTWLSDMEFKADEEWMIRRISEVNRSGQLPWLGQRSSSGFRNPGMGVWVFWGLSKIAGTEDPVSIARALECLNVSAIVLLAGFALLVVPAKERESWLWAVALISVCPTAVLIHRKIWIPSAFPICSLAALVAWWNRHHKLGAFSWGLVGACLGQIQMAGFFFAAGFSLWAFIFDRQRSRWLPWLSGTCLGAAPLIPWLVCVYQDYIPNPSTIRWSHILEVRFWTRWYREPFGLGFEFQLGDDFADFVRYPLVNGSPSYLAGVLYAVLTCAALALVVLAVARWWIDRARSRALLVGNTSATAFTLSAAGWGFGILLTATACKVQRHYLVVLFPLTFVWVAHLVLGFCRDRPATRALGRSFLFSVCLSEALLSAILLHYLHVNQRAIDGDYGTPYSAQQPLERFADDLASYRRI